MAAKRRAAKKKSARKKAGAKHRSKRRVARKRASAKRKPTTRRAAPRTRKPGKKSAAKKRPAAKKKAAKKKRVPKKRGGSKKRGGGGLGGSGTKKKPVTSPTPPPAPPRAWNVIILNGRAWPGSLPVRREDTVTWENRDGTNYTIRFANSPFLSGSRPQDIPAPAYGTTPTKTVERTKAKANYHYDIVGSTADDIPPGEPEVVVGD